MGGETQVGCQLHVLCYCQGRLQCVILRHMRNQIPVNTGGCCLLVVLHLACSSRPSSCEGCASGGNTHISDCMQTIQSVMHYAFVAVMRAKRRKYATQSRQQDIQLHCNLHCQAIAAVLDNCCSATYTTSLTSLQVEGYTPFVRLSPASA